MNLPDVWFVLIAVLWTGFFVLEGFDFGVGALHRVVSRSEHETRAAISTIGPFWDGNEVWLVVGAAGIFAAFPGWYATWLSACYLGIVLLLMALIARGVSLEFRGKVDGARWRAMWSALLTLGSLGAPLVLGLALGDLLAGLPVNGDEEFTGSFADLFTGYGVLTALALTTLCLAHGSTFLALRTHGPLAERSRSLAVWLTAAGAVVTAVLAVGTAWVADVGVGAYVLLGIPPVALVVSLFAVVRRRDGTAFAATAMAMGCTVASLFAALHPNVLVSSTSASHNLTVADAASSHYALQVMTIIALVTMPVVLLYQGYTYVVFRHRIATPGHDADAMSSA
jgi:cytochrome d ubiquinol oxidase subunit II